MAQETVPLVFQFVFTEEGDVDSNLLSFPSLQSLFLMDAEKAAAQGNNHSSTVYSGIVLL